MHVDIGIWDFHCTSGSRDACPVHLLPSKLESFPLTPPLVHSQRMRAEMEKAAADDGQMNGKEEGLGALSHLTVQPPLSPAQWGIAGPSLAT